MPSFKEIWSKIARSDRYKPVRLVIPPGQTDMGRFMETPFRTNEHYFTVRVNEMYLSYQRKWFSEYDPVVFVTSEFVYDNEKLTVPFVVGPAMFDGADGKIPLPDGMIFRNTTVAGTHPFRGDPFTLHIVLARLRQEDYLRKIIKLIETTSRAYTGGFATQVKSYTKVASVVLDGIDYLMDSKEIEPLIGHSNTIMQNANDNFLPGYYALINKDEKELDPKRFFVVNNGLQYGDSLEKSVPYRDEDYVLYSVMAVNDRNDCDLLPFKKEGDSFLRFASELAVFNADNQLQVNAKLFALQTNLRLSPDLTRGQARKLIDFYKAELEQIKEDKSHMGGGDDSTEEVFKEAWDMDMDKIGLDILKQ